MHENSSNRSQILVASLFAVVLIGGAYFFARSVESPSTAQASTETELLAKVASRDSDADGLADWEEALYGTDPQVADTRHFGMTDGAAVAKGLVVPKAVASIAAATSTAHGIAGVDSSLPVPAQGTITRALAESFATTYAKAIQNSPDGTLTDSEIKQIATDVINQLDRAIVPAPDYRSLQALKVSGVGAEALQVFAASAEAVFKANTANATTSELAYLKSVLENDDTTAFPHLISIAKVYQNTAAGLAVLPVPKELATADLMLINAMARLGKITDDFSRANSDPLATMFALKQYPDAIQQLSTAFININSVYKTAGVNLAPGEPGSRFVSLIEKLSAKQKAVGTQKP
jgi:hypothetical protein